MRRREGGREREESEGRVVGSMICRPRSSRLMGECIKWSMRARRWRRAGEGEIKEGRDEERKRTERRRTGTEP